MTLSLLKNEYPGKLIVFEGVDGAGKTTLLQKTSAFLDKNQIKHRTIKMPSHRIRALEEFRKTHESHNHEERAEVDAFSLTVLVSGDRLITLNQEVIPALKRGEWVLCDRYTYTGNICCNDPIIQSISERFIQPDLAILAEADFMTVKDRVLARPTEKHLFFDDDEVKQKISKYRQLAQQNNFMIIDTTQDQETIDQLLLARLHQLMEHVQAQTL